ncbi:YtcA family lipoprotein [Aquabacter spiritensis]|uniref:Uncharacterized protein YtcA n=1 Tax=Aquabacter spiritensis TaxID=933073 RepID=A0A4R3LYD1_9HYPH|nr:YtcA family lipoprotein [Aquabacter spiritensis]TCT05701.1 YtcA family uncharacterized protein [Aquabacter spiritensis]
MSSPIISVPAGAARARRRPRFPPRHASILAGAGLLGGCDEGGAPAIPFFGAYFPSWLLCALVGIFGAVVVRIIFIRLGIDDVLPARLPVYVCVAAGIGFLAALSAFGR